MSPVRRFERAPWWRRRSRTSGRFPVRRGDRWICFSMPSRSGPSGFRPGRRHECSSHPPFRANSRSAAFADPSRGPWDLEDFLRYFDKVNLPDAGRALVLEAFSSEPARLATAGKKNVAGAFPSDKVGCAIQWESRSTERYFVYRCEYSGDVFLYLCQPLLLKLEYVDAKGRRRTHRYTPDYLVLRAYGVYLVECKTEKELQRDQKRDRPKFHREADGTWRFPAAEKALEDTGIRFEVFSSQDASPQWLRNVKWFRDFVGATRPDPLLLDPVLDAVREAGSIRLRDLIASPGVTKEAILVGGRQPQKLGRLAALASLRAGLHVAPRDQGRTHQASLHPFG